MGRLTSMLMLMPLLICSLPARAQILSIFGYGAEARGMAGARVATGGGHSDLLYNPAHLASVDSAEISLEYGTAWPLVRATLSPNPDYTGDPAPLAGDELEPDGPGQLHYASVGFVLPLGLPGGNDTGLRGALGLSVLLPEPTVIHQSIPLEGEPLFPFIEPPERTILLLGAAVSPLPWLSVGAGVILSFSLGVVVDIDVDSAFLMGVGNELPAERVDVSATPAVAPVAGVVIRPLKGLTLAAAYRGRLAESLRAEQRIRTSGLIEQEIIMTFDRELVSLPQQIAIGAAYAIGGFRLTAELTWWEWSTYEHPAGRWHIVRRSPGSGDERSDELLAAPAGLRSTFVPAFGAEWEVLEGVRIRAGYVFARSPVPDQGGAQNLLDADRHLVSAGAGVDLPVPGALLARSPRLDLFLQYGRVVRRSFRKPEPRDERDRAAGGSLSGQLLAAGIGCTFRF